MTPALTLLLCAAIYAAGWAWDWICDMTELCDIAEGERG